MDIKIDPIITADQPWITRKLTENWGAPLVISRGKCYDASKIPGFVATYNDSAVGLVTYWIECQECEIVTLDSWLENIGVGSILIETVRIKAKQASCWRLWLITTNDNLGALKFYQKRGFHLVAVHPNALAESRKIKPSIPKIGMHGIPLRDEVELEMLLE